MKQKILILSCCFLGLLALGAQTNTLSIFPNGDLLSSNNFMLVWPTTPGVRYEVLQSTNLQSWLTVPGYPVAANGPAQQMPFVTEGAARFFQVRQLDEQPPAIVSQNPESGGFAVSRFADLTVQLSDATGIDTNSVHLTIGDLGTFTLTNAQLTFSNGVLTFFDDGSTPLGDYGTNIQVTLIAADSLGNRGTNTWNFTLELQPQVVTNLFVFGSPQAQKLGQRIGNISTAALAKRLGPVPMTPMPGSNPWTLSVESNCLVLSYTNSVPGFATNTYLCNLTPAATNEIFYRKILAVSNDAVNMLLTLFTTNVPLAEIIQQGSASLSSDSMIYNFNQKGAFLPAFSFDQTLTLPTLGTDLSGDTIYDQGGVTLKLKEGYWLLTPSLRIAFETSSLSLKRFEAEFQGDITTALVPELTFTGALKNNVSVDLFSQNYEIFLGLVGGVPIWVNLGFDLQGQLGYNLSASATMSAGVTQDMNMTFGVQYDKSASPSVSPVSTVNLSQPAIVPFTYSINGSVSAYVALVPEISARVESLAGVEANVNPKVTIGGQATFSNGQLSSADWGITEDAYLTLGLSVIGVDDSDLPALPAIKLYSWQSSITYPPVTQLAIRTQPQSENVVAGNPASFSVDAVSSQPISYQWYFNGVPMIGETGSTLTLNNVIVGDWGQYSARLTSGGQTTNSSFVALFVHAPYTPYTPLAGPIAWWTFDAKDTGWSGHITRDVSGHGNDGLLGSVYFPLTSANSPTLLANGKVGEAFFFNGSNSCITLPQSPLRNISSPCSFCTWAYTANTANFPNAWNMEIINFYADSSNGIGIESIVNSGVLAVVYKVAGTDRGVVSAQPVFINNTWVHICVVWDGSTNTLYVNGSVAPTSASPDSIARANVIGARSPPLFGEDQSTLDGAWLGGLDEMLIFNRALSASEVQSIYQAGVSGHNPSTFTQVRPPQ